MSETLNNYSEQAPSGAAAEQEYEPFNKEAAEAAKAARREEINRIQLEQAPGTIIDPDKAQFMAEAGDKKETYAAQEKKTAEEYYRDSFKENLFAPNKREKDVLHAKQALEHAKELKREANQIEDEAGEFYDDLKSA